MAILAAYANSFPGSFFFDDFDGVVFNASIRHLHHLGQVLWPPVAAGIGGRPFANLTMALNYGFGGLNAGQFHAVNLAIHITGAILLFGLVRRTLRREPLRERFADASSLVAFTVAAFWALQPVQTNVVDYVSQRTEGLMAALYLLTLYAFARSADDRSRGWAVVSVVACLLGMATKEDMATAPVLVLLYDRTFVSGSFGESLRRHRFTYVGLAATWLLLGELVYHSQLSARGVGFGLGVSWHEYAVTECRTVVRYLQRSFWPSPLIFDYGPKYIKTFADAWPGVAILAALVAVTGVTLWRRPVVGFSLAAFFVLLAPSSSVVPVAEQPCAENRLYLPLAACAVLLGAAAYRAIGRWAFAALVAAGIALGVATFARNPAFQSETAIWWDTVAKNPNNERAENNLGNSLLKHGHTQLAAPYFNVALRLSPTYADAHNNRGVTLLREGHAAEAVPEFLAAISDKPNFRDAQYNLGEAYIELGRSADAVKALEIDVKLDPDNPKAHNNLGIALLDVGRVEDSIAQEHIALRLDPEMPEAHYNLGNALGRAGRIPDALAEYDRTLKLDPNFAKAHNNAGTLLMQVGRNADARRHFEAALKINPQYADARRNLALVQGHPL
ncbi:MAG TPA: tetratricopeptide repeat protein [Opitutaceae bacterium]|nr:tetratricopeptide repeat protein [Opitutaceae bacterium]